MHPDLEKLIQLQEVELQIKDYTDRIEHLPKHLALLEEKLSATTRSLSSCQERFSKLAPEKRKFEGIIQDVTPDLLETYARIARFRKGVAIARARGDSCEACHVRIRPHVLSQIMSGETILTCDSCDRILYWKSDTPYEVRL